MKWEYLTKITLSIPEVKSIFFIFTCNGKKKNNITSWTLIKRKNPFEKFTLTLINKVSFQGVGEVNCAQYSTGVSDTGL